jgi:DnaK suppressor protein
VSKPPAQAAAARKVQAKSAKTTLNAKSSAAGSKSGSAANAAIATKAAAGKHKAAPATASKAAPKPAPKPAPKAGVKVVAKTAVKAAVKPAVKTAVKPAPKAASKPAPKPAAKVAAKAAPKVAAKPAEKTAPKTALAKAPAKAASPQDSKPVAKKAAPPVLKDSPVKPTADASASTKSAIQPAGKAQPVAALAPPAASPAKSNPMQSSPPDIKPAAKAAELHQPVPQPVAKPATKPAGKPTKISAAKAAQLAVAPASPPTNNRFMDRFAPARPHLRQMAELAETPKINYRADPKLAAAWKTKAGRDLTEPELHAMPEAEYMNDKQLDFFRARLQKQKDDLLSNAGETTEHLREDTSIVPDPADRATIEEEHALELRTRDRERKLLKKIAQSLGRLESGDYGFCDETGEPIGLARLVARPTATLSLEAQQRRELKQKMFGD